MQDLIRSSAFDSIGRTGRAGKKGTAITFMTRDDTRLAQSIARIISDAGQNVPDELAELASNSFGGYGEMGLARLRLGLDPLSQSARSCTVLFF